LVVIISLIDFSTKILQHIAMAMRPGVSVTSRFTDIEKPEHQRSMHFSSSKQQLPPF